jgi:hypothetical protein
LIVNANLGEWEVNMLGFVKMTARDAYIKKNTDALLYFFSRDKPLYSPNTAQRLIIIRNTLVQQITCASSTLNVVIHIVSIFKTGLFTM